MNGRKTNDWQVKLPQFLVQIVLALVIIAGVTVLLMPLQSGLSTSVAAMLFLIPVGICTAFLGIASGIASALAAFLSLNYFFTAPYHSFQVHHTQDLLVLVIFLVVAVVTSQLVGRIRASLAVATAREHEMAWLFQLSNALVGLKSREEVAQAIAEQIFLTARGDLVQVSLDSGADFRQVIVLWPPKGVVPVQKPALIVPIQTANRLLGEICLWRGTPAISTSDERLLNTFASQGALALERVRFRQAEQRARVLEESDRLKSVLLSSVSHELRTPLATIKAAVTSLRSDKSIWDSPARDELLAAVEEETDHLNNLVGNLLDMSRIEAGALKPERRWNVLAEIVHSAIKNLRHDTGNHHLDVAVSEDLPLVPVDYTQMERVFTNLISNSLKYSPPGTTVRIEARPKSDDELLVRVINQGPHVPEENLDRIFDKFYRITAAERVTGTGLGLSICKGFIEAHGGRIWAENLPGGFAFNFTLPLTWEGEHPLMPVDE